jgi:hypothetical protein
MIYDEIVKTPGMIEALRALANDGRLTVYSTGVVEDQISNGPNAEFRLAVPRTKVGAGVFLVGSGRIGIDRIGPDEPYESVRGPEKSYRHIADAVIAATAAMDEAILITHDKRLMSNATRQGIPTINFAAFRLLVTALSPPSGSRGT